jgi:hypothetical protein
MILSLTATAAEASFRENLSFQIRLIAIVNLILLLTSVISIIQFFLRDGHNRTPFQALNTLFTLFFYAFSLTFLLHHKSYFDGFETLSNKDALMKYFLDKDAVSRIKLLIPIACVFNIIYVIRHAHSYYLE